MAPTWHREVTYYDKKLHVARQGGNMHVAMRESWTDERLDEFGKRIDERFDRVDERIGDLRGEMKADLARVDKHFEQIDNRFEQIDKRLDKQAGSLESMQRTMVIGVIALFSAYAAGFAALLTQV